MPYFEKQGQMPARRIVSIIFFSLFYSRNFFTSFFQYKPVSLWVSYWHGFKPETLPRQKTTTNLIEYFRGGYFLELLPDLGYIEKLNSIRNWLSFSILGKLEILFSISLSYDTNKKQSL